MIKYCIYFLINLSVHLHGLLMFFFWLNYRSQVVGWPPVRSYRKKMMKGSKFVKVAVDGAPYLRKIDLESHNGYQQLLAAFEDMFTFLTICKQLTSCA